MPKVSVLLPVYNAETYLRDAIVSICNQTERDFELLLIDDGSTDHSIEIASTFRDKRIRLFQQPNEGLIAKLNFGLAIAQGDYIARMDADDISLPNRLQEQCSFLERHSNIGVCGTWSMSFMKNGKSWETHQPVNPDIAWATLLFRVPLSHPTVMFRASSVHDGHWQYSPIAQHAEDYDLWARIGENTKLGNVPRILLKYRVHENQVSQHHFQAQNVASDATRRFLLEKLGIFANDKEFSLHGQLVKQQFQTGIDWLNLVDSWFTKIWHANIQMQRYQSNALQDVFRPLWFGAAFANRPFGQQVRSIQRHNPMIGPKTNPRLLLRTLRSYVGI